ncbi:sortase domain-bontaining protein [Streptomyces sp. I05A-00742]|uniref:sortase domain-containing protein n=1 Tax=Streptomyces sp. I05A-00742 TaxID=2732853 RepID=UPI001489788E|nr:sortase [Streptomyces sp. I05A-00742]
MSPSRRPALARTALVLAALVLPALLLTGLTGCSLGGIDNSKTIGTPASADEPQRVRIPSLHVDSPLIRLGRDKDPDRRIQAPPPDRSATAGWYTGSVMPGRPGVAVIIGHRQDHDGKAAVFRELSTLRKGADIDIERGDGKILHFTVTAVRTVDRDEALATRKDHAAADARHPGTGPAPAPEKALRLVTCAGDGGPGGGRDQSTVVDATLRS